MKCQQCEFENREGVKFCEKCGTKLELICSGCGARIPLDRLFCGECGRALKEPEEAPPIDYSRPESYTPKFLADKILTTRSSVEGERKLVTVLFADVANYTSMSERLDPEEVHQIMDGCFKILMDEIHRYEGTINQFTGDGVMALFGAPVAHEDHAQRACHAALAIQKAIGEYGEKVEKECGVEFKMRVGLNSGPVIVGSVGDDLRLDYTAVGDTTNLAARMESMAKPGTVLVSRDTNRLARDYFEFKSLGKVEIKGKEEAQDAFELIKAGEVETKIEAAAVKGLTKFVGRKNSMAALMEPYERAKAGSGQVVGIVGEAGVGKSRLLLEFRNRLPQDEFGYLEGRCLHYGGSMPYLPILDILRAYFEIKGDDREFVIKKKMEEKILHLDENLKGVLPSFQDLLSLKVEDETYLKLEPKQKRDRAFEAIRDLIIRESQGKIVIVAVEDLHWIDKTSEEFLNYLIGWLANARVLLVLLYRPEYTHQWGSKSFYNHIGLTQLTTQSSTELVQAILEGADVVAELRDLILGRTSGNPLFMEEFTHTLLENGSIQKKDDQFILSRKPSEIQVPDTIHGIISARMDRLEDNLKRTMQVASVIGRDFAFRILQTITGTREELKSYLLNLQGLEFIYEKRLFPELEYIFKHALTQEVAYNSLLAKRRKEIHEKIGVAIEEIYPERLEELYEMLAYHFFQGEIWDKAVTYFRQAGAKAFTRSANREAVTCFEQALTALSHLPDTREKLEQAIDLRFDLRTSLFPLGEVNRLLDHLRDAESLARTLNDQRRLGLVSVYMAHYFLVTGESRRARQSAETAHSMAKLIEDFTLHIAANFYLGWASVTLGDHHGAEACLRKVVESLKGDLRRERCGLTGFPAVMARWLLAESFAHRGEFEEGIAWGHEGIRLAEELDHAYSLILACWGLAHVYGTRGELGEAVRVLERGLTVCHRWNVSVLVPWTLGYQGFTCAHLGRVTEGLSMLHDALRALQSTQAGGTYRARIFALLGEAYVLAGRLEPALEFAERALSFASKRGQRGHEALTLRVVGEIAAHREPADVKRALGYYHQSLALAEELGMRPLVAHCHLGLGKLYRRTGDRPKAQEHLTTATTMLREMDMRFWLAQAEVELKELG